MLATGAPLRLRAGGGGSSERLLTRASPRGAPCTPSTSYAPVTCSAPLACRAHARNHSLWSRTHTTRCTVAAAAAAAHGPASPSGGKVGVVVVDHGSRKKASNDMLDEFVQLYGRLTGAEVVEAAHMEIARPSIADAIARCVARGASTVVVAPYFLSRGRHIQEDIPALVAAAAPQHPGVRCVIADPIGIDPLMVQLISNRVAAALEGSGGGEAPGAAGAAAGAEAVHAPAAAHVPR